MPEKISVSLEDITSHCRGELIGNPRYRVSRLAGMAYADASSLGFIRDSAKNLPVEWKPGAVLLRHQDREGIQGNRIIVDDPYLAYARVTELFRPPGRPRTIHPTAIVEQRAVLGDGVRVGANSVIESGCEIGANVDIGHNVVLGEQTNVGADTVIESGVVLHRDTTLGERCYLSSGVVIGANGFGYAPHGTQWKKIYQLGAVTIGNDVDIGANTTIDRGSIDNTVIGDRVKLDNQIQIAHNVHVGDDTIMAGCVAVAGSAVIGKRCQIGGRASILGHLELIDDVILQAGAFVARSINEPGVYASMIPAQPARQWRKVVGYLGRLEQLARTVKALAAGRSGKNQNQ